MTDMTSDEWAEKIIRSLRENSADFKRQRRTQRYAKARRILIVCLIFAAGLAAGILLKTAL
jgi:hypothetical protein